jgi:HEAT repeats
MALRTDRTMSRRATLALAALLLASHALANGPWDTVPTPLDQMAEAGFPPDPALIADALRNTAQSSELRFTAALALAQLGAHSQLPALLEVLDDADPEVVSGVLSALHHLPDPQTVRPVCDALMYHPHPLVRQQAMGALLINDVPGARQCLVTVATDPDQLYEARAQILYQLLRRPANQPEYAGLEPLLTADDSYISAYAGLILARQDATLNGTRDPKPIARALARTAIAGQLAAEQYRQVIDQLEALTGENFTAYHWNNEPDMMIQSMDTRTTAERLNDWLGANPE